MAMLLAVFQKMRLTREKNELVYKLAKLTGRKRRITDNINRVQKMYTKRLEGIKQQATQMKNAASIFFQNQLFGPNVCMNYNQFGGLNSFVQGIIGDMLVKGGKDAQGNPIQGMDSTKAAAMLQAYQSSGMRFVDNGNGTFGGAGNSFTQEEVDRFMYALQAGNSQFSQRQWYGQQLNANYEQEVSIWLQMQEAQAEAEQDEALAPLNEEDTMIDLDKAAIDQRLEVIRSELESYNTLCKEEAKDSAPTFGLS